MCDALFMKIGQSTEQLPHYTTDSSLRKGLILFDQINKWSTFAVLHNDVVVSFKKVNFIQFHDIGVI